MLFRSEVALLMMVELILVKTQMHVTLEKRVIVNTLKSILIVMVTVLWIQTAQVNVVVQQN